jgi:NAD(P)H dehydrogenase (quinone)
MPVIERARAALLLVDFQSRLMPAIDGGASVVANAGRLLDAAQMFDVPVVFTGQNPGGLGLTVPGAAVRGFVVYCHPNDRSFASALHQTVLKALRSSGHEVTDLDLYTEDFRPVMSREERKEYEDPAQYRGYALQLAETDAIVAVYPTWWYGLPAILKGYFDRVWAPGIAFDRGADGVFQTDRLANIRKLGVVTRYGSRFGYTWRSRAKALGPRDPQFVQQRLHPGRACPLQYGQVAAERLERFRKRTGNAFARW